MKRIWLSPCSSLAILCLLAACAGSSDEEPAGTGGSGGTSHSGGTSGSGGWSVTLLVMGGITLATMLVRPVRRRIRR
jgi:hypothetical protein